MTDILAERIPDASARMQLRNMGELGHPAACAVCGNGTCDEGYVDIGVYYEYEGMMYLCIPCLTEAAETGGMLSIEQVRELKEITNEALAENKVLKTRQVKMNERLKHYDALLGINADGVPTVTDDPADVVTDESNVKQPKSEQGDGAVTAKSDDGGKEVKPEPVKSASSGKRHSGSARTTGSNELSI